MHFVAQNVLANLMMARYYSAGLSRFLSVDPGDDSDLENPQSWNKYTYVRNNPVAFADPDGRTIEVKVHAIPATGYSHTSTLIIPNDQSRYKQDRRFRADPKSGTVYATIGAEGQWNRLVSDTNRTKDVILSNATERLQVDLGGRNENAVIEQLFANDANYGDNLNYDYFPTADGDGYNSNSYTPGLLNSVGLSAPQPEANVPGYEKPVPGAHFKPKGGGARSGSKSRGDFQRPQQGSGPGQIRFKPSGGCMAGC